MKNFPGSLPLTVTPLPRNFNFAPHAINKRQLTYFLTRKHAHQIPALTNQATILLFQMVYCLLTLNRILLPFGTSYFKGKFQSNTIAQTH